MATKQQEELAAWMLAAGISAHAVSDILSRGRLTRIETGLLIKVLKKVVPFVGRTLATEVIGGVTTGALITRAAARAATVGAAGAVARNPYTLAAALLVAGYIKREELAEVGAAIAEDPRTEAAYEQLLQSGQAGREFLREPAQLIGAPGARPISRIARMPGVKRKVSKANRAVKEGMRLLKAGGKAISGSPAGTLPKAAFRIATKAAGMANPKTKSKPGKGKSIMNKLARRLKKWW